MSESFEELPDVPMSWIRVKISDIGQVVSGGTPSTNNEGYFNGDVPWITPADLTNYKSKLISRGKRNISLDGLKNSSAKLVPSGSILFSSRAPIGYVVIAANQIATNQGFKNLIPSPYLFNEYIYYYLLSSKQLAERFASGTTFKEISGTSFGKLPIPFPPLPEQHRIVAKLEELFTKLDVSVAELKKAKAQIKRYRQSVLKSAFEGKLTEQWRIANCELRNETAEELLAKIKDERKKALGNKYKELPLVDTTNLPQLPETWVWSQLDYVCNKIQDGTHFSPKIQYEERLSSTYPYVTAKNIKEYGLDLSKLTFIDYDFHKTIYKRCNPELGDILLTKDGAKTGVVALNTIDEEFSLLSSVALLKPNKNILFNKFLLYYLKSELGLQMILGKMTGVAIKRIILEKINSSVIPITSIDEQMTIANEIERHFSVADATEKIIDQSLKQAERLRQSILKDAFTGKLVPQDPNDEPASLLLEKIKEERVKLNKESKPKRRTSEPAEKLLERKKVEKIKTNNSNK